MIYKLQDKESKKLFDYFIPILTSAMTGGGESSHLHSGGLQHSSDNQSRLWHDNTRFSIPVRAGVNI